MLGFPTVLQEMENQRGRLESLLKQNDVIRQQLEATRVTSTAKVSRPHDKHGIREICCQFLANHIFYLQIE